MNDKTGIFNVLTTLALKEAELLWVRYTTMLYTNTGLVAILAYALENKSTGLIVGIAVVGVIMSIVWVQMIRLSSYYYQRWQIDADQLVQSDKYLSEVIRGRLNPRLEKPANWSASTYGKIIPFIFIVGWVIVILDALSIIEII